MALTGNANEESQEATGAEFRLRLLSSQAVRAEAVRAPAAALAAPHATAHAARGQPSPGDHPQPAHAARGAAPDRQQERGGDAAAAGGAPGL